MLYSGSEQQKVEETHRIEPFRGTQKGMKGIGRENPRAMAQAQVVFHKVFRSLPLVLPVKESCSKFVALT